MTVTTPGTPARRRAPRLAAAVAAVVTAFALLSTGAAVAAPAPSPSPTAPSDVPAGTSVFTLAPVSNGIVRAGDALNVSVALQNGTDAELPPVAVTLSLGSSPLRDRAALTTWLDSAGTASGLAAVGSVGLEAVAPGSERIASIVVPSDDPALSGRAPGVYPLVASYESAAGVVASPSVMVVPADDGREVGVGVVVPITAGARAEALLSADELAVLTAPDGALTAQLNGVDGTAAILAVDPAIPAAIRVLGASAPATAVEWLTRLEQLPNSRFALQFGDADVTPQLEGGLPRPLAPTSFTAFMRPSDFATPTPEPSPTPTSTPTPTTPGVATGLPTTAELLAVGADARAGVFWPADGTAGPDVVGQLGGLVIDETESLTVVPSTSTADGAAGGTVPAHATTGDAGLLVFDADVSRLLAAASATDTPGLRGAPLSAATAYLSFATADADGPLLVTVGRNAARSHVGLSTSIATAVSAPGATPQSLEAIVAGAPVETRLQEVEPEAIRAAAASTLVGDEGDLARFATILDDPALLTGPARAELLQLLGVAWLDADGWAAAVAEHRATTAETLDAVGLVPTSPSDLYGSSAALRFWVRNELPYPVNLVLYTVPDNLRLDVQGETPVVATPNSNTRVEVPVQARVGRGDVTLTLQLRSPAFVAIGDPETVEINVFADWEAWGIAVLAVIVGGLLVVGVIRTVLRVRRRRAADASPSGGDDGAGAVDAEPVDAVDPPRSVAGDPAAEADGRALDSDREGEAR